VYENTSSEDPTHQEEGIEITERTIPKSKAFRLSIIANSCKVDAKARTFVEA